MDATAAASAEIGAVMNQGAGNPVSRNFLRLSSLLRAVSAAEDSSRMTFAGAWAEAGHDGALSPS